MLLLNQIQFNSFYLDLRIGAAVSQPGAYGQGSGSIILDDVQCNGTEARLVDCEHGEWGESYCPYAATAGVICLVGKLACVLQQLILPYCFNLHSILLCVHVK